MPEESAHKTSIRSRPMMSILSFAMRIEVCGCIFSPVNLMRRDRKESESHLHCALIINIH